jgi:hypothetical protein
MRHIARQPRGEIRGQDTYCSKFSCLALNGPIDQLRTNYSSDPSLPAADIINLLSLYLAYCLVLVSPCLQLLAIPFAAPVSDRCASREMPEDTERSVRLPREGPRRFRTQSDQTCGVEVETWPVIG